MAYLQSAEDLNHFVSVMLLVCIRVGKLQAPENPIEMQPIQLIMLSVCVRQMQARDPTGMKIVYEMANLFAEIAQGRGFSEHIWLERCYFARMYESSQPISIVISTTEQRTLLSWSFGPAPSTAPQTSICHVSRVFAPTRQLMPPGSKQHLFGLFLNQTGPKKNNEKRNTIGKTDSCELKLQKLLKTDLVLSYVLIAFFLCTFHA